MQDELQVGESGRSTDACSIWRDQQLATYDEDPASPARMASMALASTGFVRCRSKPAASDSRRSSSRQHPVLDLTKADLPSLRREFSVVLEKTVLELRGVPCLSLEEAPAAKQQILVSRSFGKPVIQVEAIVEAVSEFTSRAAEELRQQHSVAGAIQVFFTTSPFRANDRQHSPSVTVPLKATSDTRHWVSAAVNAVRQAFRPGFNYTKAGAMLIDLQDHDPAQQQTELDLFEAPAPTSAAANRAKDRPDQQDGSGARCDRGRCDR